MIFLKIHVNYDLMEEIDIANKGLRLQKIADYILKLETFNYGMLTCIDFICLPDHKIMWGPNFIRCLLGFVGITATMSVLMKPFQANVKLKANTKLAKLALDLFELNVYTTYEMLKGAEIVKTNYKFKLNDKKIPVLKQNKCIKIPVVNGMGKRFEETLYQEHIVGTRSYDLSVKKPDEKVQVKRKLAVQM